MKKDDDDDGRQTHQKTALIAEAIVEEVRDGDGVARNVGVQADALCDDQPVDVRTDGQTDCVQPASAIPVR